MGLGQALGDGNAFFLVNPMALIFIPYVMSNYWAMTFIPFLIVQKYIPIAPQRDTWAKYVLPVIVLPAAYLFVGAIIFTAGSMLGWIPK